MHCPVFLCSVLKEAYKYKSEPWWQERYESTYFRRHINGKAVCISHACYAMSSSHFLRVISKQKRKQDTGTKGTYPTRNSTASQSCRQELPSEKPFQAEINRWINMGGANHLTWGRKKKFGGMALSWNGDPYFSVIERTMANLKTFLKLTMMLFFFYKCPSPALLSF